MMKKIKFLIPFAALGLVLTSCSQGPTLSSYFDDFTPEDIEIPTPWVDYGLPLQSITFASGENEITVEKEQTHTYQYTCVPTDAAIEWVSDNENVATVSKGVVTAVDRGEAHITVSGGEGSTATPTVLTVHVSISVSDIALTSDQELNLDYGAQSQITVEFTPDNTTQTELSYVSSNEDVAAVSETGLITAKSLTGVSTITVTSPHLDKSLSVTVNVSDQYEYISSLTLSSSASSVELGKTVTLTPTILPTNATYTNVQYESTTPEIVSVNAQGEVTALAEGAGKVRAFVEETRKGTTFYSDELTINVFEVKATAISLGEDSKVTVEMDNKTNNSHQLSYTYTVDMTGYTKPTRGNVSYESSVPGVATVSNSGLISYVGNGTTRVTITDTQYNVSDYVDVHVTTLATSVTIVSNKTKADLNENVTLTATVKPDNTTDKSVTFSNPDPDNITVTNNNDGTATVSSTVEGTFNFTATCNGVTSLAVAVTFELAFVSNTVYLVGSSDFHTGTSDPLGGQSWTRASKAFILDEDLGQDPDIANLNYQMAGTVTLNQGDQFLIRVGPDDDTDFRKPIVWIEDEPEVWNRYNHYVIDSGVGIHPIDTDGSPDYANFEVDTTGTYRIIYKIYDLGKANEWYSIDIGFPPVFEFEVAPTNVYVGHTVTAKVSNWDTTLVVTKNNDNINMAVDYTNGEITITGVTVGSTKISATDKNETIDFTISVTEAPTDFESGHIYLVGSKDFSSGTSADTGASWNAYAKAFELVDTVDDPSLKTQYKATITFADGVPHRYSAGTATKNS